MEIKEIESVVLTELYGKHGLDSLQVQNHVYGCFILMEDIAEGTVRLEEGKVVSDGYCFDLEGQFSEIGIRYGFIMDMSLEWNHYSVDYKTKWMEIFKELECSHNIERVELIQDALIAIVKANVGEEDAFLTSALEQGVLSREWQDKFIRLVRDKKKVIQLPKEEDKEEEDVKIVTNVGIARAQVEKLIQDKRVRGLRKTRRNRKGEIKRQISKTRRHVRV